MEYDLVRSRRRSISLQVEHGGVLKVRAPFWMPPFAIKQFVTAKSDWVARQIKRLNNSRNQFEYGNGDRILYLGQELVIRMDSRRSLEIILNDAEIILPEISSSQAKILIHSWLKRMGTDYLTQRLRYYSNQMHIEYKHLKISNARTRWGSCSSDGSIRLNWRLICANPEAIDYVIVHELAHIKQHNHSQAFWAIVELIEPNYREYRRWFKNNGYLLSI